MRVSIGQSLEDFNNCVLLVKCLPLITLQHLGGFGFMRNYLFEISMCPLAKARFLLGGRFNVYGRLHAKTITKEKWRVAFITVAQGLKLHSSRLSIWCEAQLLDCRG